MTSTVVHGFPPPPPPERHQLRDLFAGIEPADVLPVPGSWQPVPSFADRGAWQAVRPDIAGYVTARSGALAGTPWPQLLARHTERFLRDGDRSEFEALYFGRRSRVIAHVLAVLITADDAAFAEMVDGLWLICEETQWSIPAHDRFALDAGEGLPDQQRPFLDLFAADTASLMAWTAIVLGEEIRRREPALFRRMVDETRRRVVRPYLDRDWHWYGPRDGRAPNNWNPWIHSNVLPAALVFGESTEQLAATVHKTVTGLDLFLDGYPDDGGCDEGVSYWWRAGATLVECLLTLSDASGGRLAGLGLPVLHPMARYPLVAAISTEWNVNFADGSARSEVGENANLLYRMGKVFADDEMVAHALAIRTPLASLTVPGISLERLLFAAVDRAWAEDTSAGRAYAGAADVLPETEVVTVREHPGEPGRGFFLAGKGGHNAESHNHNDVGTFILAQDGRPLLIDVGVESYSRKTFGPERYTIWTMRSSFHNLPTVNGVEQAPGRPFAARDFVPGLDDAGGGVAVELADAYPPEAGIGSWRRSMRLDRSAGTVTVDDAWSLERDANDIDLTLMTADEPDVSTAGRITWVDRRATVDYDGGRFSPEVERIDFDDAKLTPVWGHHVWRIRLRASGVTGTGTHTLNVRASSTAPTERNSTYDR